MHHPLDDKLETQHGVATLLRAISLLPDDIRRQVALTMDTGNWAGIARVSERVTEYEPPLLAVNPMKGRHMPGAVRSYFNALLIRTQTLLEPVPETESAELDH